ncbi:hypothetical protein PoB_003314000 [Plakobranchus ocellatus]|uniref:ZSWIM3 N-terminal domain-containing protein n=1 Tax=Plakobranchus ocellatus TaxID=259542 RepID=A0AAV4AGZ4_9GAST|nr:hypothetical protein PoB_003314000 [Plakobranchus ocellatus]
MEVETTFEKYEDFLEALKALEELSCNAFVLKTSEKAETANKRRKIKVPPSFPFARQHFTCSHFGSVRRTKKRKIVEETQVVETTKSNVKSTKVGCEAEFVVCFDDRKAALVITKIKRSGTQHSTLDSLLSVLTEIEECGPFELTLSENKEDVLIDMIAFSTRDMVNLYSAFPEVIYMDGKRAKAVEVVDDIRVAEGAEIVDSVQVVEAVGSVGDFEINEDVVSGFDVMDCAGNVETFDTHSIGVDQAGEDVNDLGVHGGSEVAGGAKVVEVSDCVELVQAVDDDAKTVRAVDDLKAVEVSDGSVKVVDGVEVKIAGVTAEVSDLFEAVEIVGDVNDALTVGNLLKKSLLFFAASFENLSQGQA